MLDSVWVRARAAFTWGWERKIPMSWGRTSSTWGREGGVGEVG